MRQLLQPAVTSSLCLHVHGKVKVVTYYPWPQALHRDQKQASVFLGALIHGILPGVHTNISIMTKRQKWMALEWVIAHIRRKWFNRSTSKHVNLILVTKNSALPHEFLHDMVLDPRQLRFQCYIVVPSGTAALQQLQAWKTTTDTMICSMLPELAGSPAIKHTWKDPEPPTTGYWVQPTVCSKDAAPAMLLQSTSQSCLAAKDFVESHKKNCHAALLGFPPISSDILRTDCKSDPACGKIPSLQHQNQGGTPAAASSHQDSPGRA